MKENGYACFKMENKFLILFYLPDVLVEIFAGTQFCGFFQIAKIRKI